MESVLNFKSALPSGPSFNSTGHSPTPTRPQLSLLTTCSSSPAGCPTYDVNHGALVASPALSHTLSPHPLTHFYSGAYPPTPTNTSVSASSDAASSVPLRHSGHRPPPPSSPTEDRIVLKSDFIGHPYARLRSKQQGAGKRRKMWNHNLEKMLFSPQDMCISSIIVIVSRLTPSLSALVWAHHNGERSTRLVWKLISTGCTSS